jgi:hypothetical protein
VATLLCRRNAQVIRASSCNEVEHDVWVASMTGPRAAIREDEPLS